jgi:hypothetical protein
VPTTLINAGVGTPQLDLESKLQTMDDTFKKTYQGLKDRRKGVSRMDQPTFSAAVSSSAVRPFSVPAAGFLMMRLARLLIRMVMILLGIILDV